MLHWSRTLEALFSLAQHISVLMLAGRTVVPTAAGCIFARLRPLDACLRHQPFQRCDRGVSTRILPLFDFQSLTTCRLQRPPSAFREHETHTSSPGVSASPKLSPTGLVSIGTRLRLCKGHKFSHAAIPRLLESWLARTDFQDEVEEAIYWFARQPTRRHPDPQPFCSKAWARQGCNDMCVGRHTRPISILSNKALPHY